MGLSAKLCIFQPLSGNTRQLPALSGALGQGGNSQAGRAGVRALLPTTISVWFSHCLSQCQGLAPLGTGSEHTTSNSNSFTVTSASAPTATVSMLSTLHVLFHSVFTPIRMVVLYFSYFVDKKTRFREVVICYS